MDAEIIFTDGSCIRNGKPGAKGGWGVFFGDNHEKNSHGPQSGPKHSNQLGELEAILHALKLADDNKHIFIYTDSKYSIDCLTNWIIKWKINNWKKANGTDVIHSDLIKEIDDLIQLKKKVEFIHIRSHQTEPRDKLSDEYFIWYGNHQADLLASYHTR